MTIAQANTAADATIPAADVAPAAAEVKPVSKMAQSEVLYTEVFTPGYDLAGKSQRAVFIKRAMEELSLSKNCANTYYQNLSNDARGKGKYKYNKYVGKAGSKSTEAKAPVAGKEEEAGLDLPGAAIVSKSDIKNAEALVGKTTADLTKRWQLLDDGEVINSFDTRNQAKKAAVGGLTWADASAK